MPTVDHVLPFPSNLRKRQAQASLRDATCAGVRRLISMAPILGRTNPAGVPVVENVMRNLIDAPPDGEGGRERPADTGIAQESRTPEAEYGDYYSRRRQIQAEYIRRREFEQRTGVAWVIETLDEWWERQQREPQRQRQREEIDATMRMLRDQVGDLSAAS
jgi:hypothetical protein